MESLEFKTNTQLELDYLELLPNQLYRTRFYPLFPAPWHIFLNKVWLLQLTVAILFCIRENRWIMQPHPPKSIFIKQFYFMLFAHSIFYIMEMLITSISVAYPSMLFHHINALTIFFGTFFSQHKVISVVYLMPFVGHALYWAQGDYDNRTLAIYNLTFLYAGLFGVWEYIHKRGSTTYWIMPVLCITNTSINYYTYCQDFNGEYCPIGWFEEDDDTLGNRFFAFCLAIATTISIFCVSIFFKQRWDRQAKDRLQAQEGKRKAQ